MARGDVLAVHEPFSRLADFGEAQVEGRTIRSEDELIHTLCRIGEETCVFFKDTMDFRYERVLADDRFLRDATHTFLIRRPDEVIASHFALNPNLERDEIGFAYLHELYLAVVDAQGVEPVVLDSADLLENPEAAVRAYCDRTGLKFDEAALRWPPGMRPEWGRTERWHADVSETDGFVARQRVYSQTVYNNEILASYHKYHLPFFEYLRARRVDIL